MATDAAFLAEIPLFARLDDEERALLAEVVDHHHADAGETLFNAGEPGDALYVVRSGEVELHVTDNVGQKIVLHVACAGHVFGEISMLDQGPRTATATALGAVDLIVLDREDLRLLFTKKPDAALDMLAAMSAMTRKADQLLRSRVSKNVNEEVEEKLTVVERVSDWISWFSGSMQFLTLNLLWFGGWIGVHSLGLAHFDPYPFQLLTMIVSLQAIFLSIFVLISQNRQSAKDRIRSDVEYEINVKAELQIAAMHGKVDKLHELVLDRLARVEKAVGKPRE